MKYRFEIHRAAGLPDENHERDLPDDDAALDWMGGEALLGGERIHAYRGEETTRFASREFGMRASLRTGNTA
jgi:hypothetical protein